jgi:hypothetical protein
MVVLQGDFKRDSFKPRKLLSSSVPQSMGENLRQRLREAHLDEVVAKGVFLLVALVCIYQAVIQIQHWGRSLIYLLLALVSGILIEGGYEDIKINLMKAIGMEVSSDVDNRTAPDEVQNLLRDRNPESMIEIEVDEVEGKYRVEFERE